MHGVPALKPGQWIGKGTTLGYIGAEGHVHVQERARNDASIPIDPSAHLAAAASPAGLPPGISPAGLNPVAAQSFGGYQPWTGTGAGGGMAARSSTTVHQPIINNDFTGATFTDISRAEVEQLVIRATVAGLESYVSTTRGEIAAVGNRGQLR